MWSRFRRRTFAPRRPALYPDQWTPVVLTLLAVGLGVLVVVLVVRG